VTPITSGQRNVVEQAILGEVHRIETEQAVRQRLLALDHKLDYVRRGIADIVLRSIVDRPGYVVQDAFQFSQDLVISDAGFLEYANAPAALRHLDKRVVDICQAVLEVAWEDKVTFDEYRLIRRLEEKLQIGRRDHLVMEARITRRPAYNTQDIDEGIRSLRMRASSANSSARGARRSFCLKKWLSISELSLE
jgi:hypothetical protein